MKSIGIVRRIDDLGRIAIPKEIRNNLRAKGGDAFEIHSNNRGEIIIRKYRKSWEETVLEWWEKNYNRPAMRRASFSYLGDYTFCIVRLANGRDVAGFAKRYCRDEDNASIGQVAAFARAIGTPINELVGWEG